MMRQTRAGRSPRSGVNVVDSAALLAALSAIFHRVNAVEDVLIVCRKACLAIEADQVEEIGNVLCRCGVDPLFVQLRELSKVIEGLGGETYLTGDLGDDE